MLFFIKSNLSAFWNTVIVDLWLHRSSSASCMFSYTFLSLPSRMAYFLCNAEIQVSTYLLVYSPFIQSLHLWLSHSH